MRDIPSVAKPSSLVGSAARARFRRWLKGLSRMLWAWNERGGAYAFERALVRLGLRGTSYRNWIKANDSLSAADVLAIKQRITELRAPTVTLIVVSANGSLPSLRRTIQSVRAQHYEDWEVYILDVQAGVPVELDQQLLADPRIKLLHIDGELPTRVNQTCKNAVGEFVGFLDAGDELASSALYLAIEAAETCNEAAILYSDEDTITLDRQRKSPIFKSDWNPDLFLSRNYLGRLTLYKRERLPNPVFREGFSGGEEYDLALRMTQLVPASAIRHIPFVLAHRSGGPKPLPAASRMRAAEQYLQRDGISARVELTYEGRELRVRRRLPPKLPQVSIIIPTRDGVHLLRGCIDSLLARTDYANFEIVVVDNQSSDPEALAYLRTLTTQANIRVLSFDQPFNFSAINNFAATHSAGAILAFLNNDIVVKSSEWLHEMVSHVQRPEVGAVGAMLYYPDDVIQHAGIILGFGGVAANCFVGLKQGAPGYNHRAEAVQNYSAVTGACMLTRADVFATVGGFEEALPVAFNDVDFCLRLRERGYLITWTPHAELYHLESVTRGDDLQADKIERFRRDQAYMRERWGGVIANDPYYNPNLALEGHQFSLAAHSRVVPPWHRDEHMRRAGGAPDVDNWKPIQ